MFFFNYSVCIYYSFFIFFFSLSFFILGVIFIYLNKVLLMDWSLLRTLKCDLVVPFILDSYGLLFSSLVLFISGNIFIFADYYIEGEVYIERFIIIVVLFVISINFLIYIPHFIALLLGWDGLGIVSFLLVIYYQNSKSLAAGMLTVLRNRIGDVFILLRIGWCINQGHWLILDISINNKYSSLIIFRIIIAGITKRAQIPFSSWLPAAIAAPTPVSALVHSSTLVTAGVFLMVRFYPFLSSHYLFNNLILIISCITIFIAGLSAIFECDIKKVVALSTLRQLGVIMSAIGLGFPVLAFFHLITHALFKALLFVCVGSFIHLHIHRQDIRFMGNLIHQIPLTCCCLNIANMALCGLPFLSGFYSKDLIIEVRLFYNYNFIIILLFVFSTILTSCYSLRIVLRGLSSENIRVCIHIVRDNTSTNTFPIIILCLGAIIRGCAINWIFIMPYIDPCIPIYFKLLAFILTLIGGYFRYLFIIKLNNSLPLFFSFFFHINCYMWFIVPSSTQVFLKYPIFLGKYSLSLLDQGWVETLGSQGLHYKLKIFYKSYENVYNLILSSFFLFIVLLLISIFFFFKLYLYIL